jgi:hypothetical protein
LEYVDNKVHIIDTNNIITHIIGIDFNSLYPSSYSSLPHLFNPYTGGVMYMPGPLKSKITDPDVAMRIIKERKEIFSVDVKGHIDNRYLNEIVRFPPIFMNVDITTNKETIGESMYKYMISNGMEVDKKERKLTQLTDTHNEYRLTNNYLLWFLIDTCHFIINSIKVMYVYEKHMGFRAFTEEMTRLRQEAKLRSDGGGDEFYKLVLNGSYGYDFMYKCLDMTRLHFVEGDTDSMYWAVSGSESDSYEQQFKHVIKDHNFYNNNIYKFTPSSFYSSNNSNPTFDSGADSTSGRENEIKRIAFDKKLLGLLIEKQCENMLALAPKTYSCSVNSDKNKPWIDFNNIKIIATKCKGYSVQGKLKFKDYFDIYAEKLYIHTYPEVEIVLLILLILRKSYQQLYEK